MSSSNWDVFLNLQEAMLHDRLHLQLLYGGEGGPGGIACFFFVFLFDMNPIGHRQSK